MGNCLSLLWAEKSITMMRIGHWSHWNLTLGAKGGAGSMFRQLRMRQQGYFHSSALLVLKSCQVFSGPLGWKFKFGNDFKKNLQNDKKELGRGLRNFIDCRLYQIDHQGDFQVKWQIRIPHWDKSTHYKITGVNVWDYSSLLKKMHFHISGWAAEKMGLDINVVRTIKLR